MKPRKKMIRCAIAGTLLTAVLSLLSWDMKGPTSHDMYDQVSTMLKTKGTRLSTVKLWSKDGRTASGTAVKNGTTEIIITVAHFFSTRHPDTEFWYTLNNESRPITTVFPHPKPGSMGGKDIAFCLPGKSKIVRNFWQLERDEVHLNPRVRTCVPFDVRLLEGSQVLTIMGTIANDEKDALYIVPHITRNGDSGSGLMAHGRFFVIKGNIPSSSLDIRQIFGVSQSNLTIVTEL